MVNYTLLYRWGCVFLIVNVLIVSLNIYKNWDSNRFSSDYTIIKPNIEVAGRESSGTSESKSSYSSSERRSIQSKITISGTGKSSSRAIITTGHSSSGEGGTSSEGGRSDKLNSSEGIKEVIKWDKGWYISMYYTPVKGQLSYFNGDYSGDYTMNCHGDCLVTASGYRLKEEDKYQVIACPPPIKFGTKIMIKLPSDHPLYPNKEWTATCQDRGGAIKGKRLDLWSGIGVAGKKVQDAVWIGELSSKNASIYIIK